MFWWKLLYNYDNCMPFLCTIWYSQFDSWVRISMNMYHQRSSWFKNQIRFTKFYQVYWSLRILPSFFLSRWDYDIKVSVNDIKCSRWLISEIFVCNSVWHTYNLFSVDGGCCNHGYTSKCWDYSYWNLFQHNSIVIIWYVLIRIDYIYKRK